MTARTQEEILARLETITRDGDDWCGFRSEVLIAAMDYDHAKPFLNDGVTPEQWAGEQVTDTETAAKDYYTFALGPIHEHRGISANRSVEKLTEYAWLLGRDDVLAAMEAAEWAQYGAPKVKAFGAAFGLAWPDDPAMVRMAEGLPCEADCYEGCSA